MTTTSKQYTATHAAIRDASREFNLSALAIRVLMALEDRGGESYSGELTEDLQLRPNDSSLRRCMSELRPRFVVGGDKQGVQSKIQIQEDGLRVVTRVQSLRKEASSQ